MLLGPKDLVRIDEAVKAVEARTAGEIAVVVVPSSGGYHASRALVAAVLTFVVTQLAFDAFFHFDLYFDPRLVLLGQGVFALLAWILAGLEPILRRVVPEGTVMETVDARAKRAFVEHGIVETQARSGVLILVSELEHRVQVLADRGVHAHVGSEGWQKHVDTMVTQIRAGRAADGIIAAVTAMGDQMAHAVPPRPNDVNELPNVVRE